MSNAEQGQAQTSQTEEVSQPQYVTKDDIAAIVNAAVSSHLKRSLDKSIGSALDAALAPIKSKLDAPPPSAEEKTQQKQGPSPEVAALQKQLADMQAAMAKANADVAAERKRNHETAAYSALKSELGGKVRPEALDAAADLIFHARKHVTVDDDGNATFKVRSSRGKGMPEEDLEYQLADGVREFLKTKDAALFLPSPGGQAANGGRAPQQTRTQQPSQRQSPRYDSPAASEEEKLRRAVELFAAKGLDLP